MGTIPVADCTTAHARRRGRGRVRRPTCGAQRSRDANVQRSIARGSKLTRSNAAPPALARAVRRRLARNAATVARVQRCCSQGVPPEPSRLASQPTGSTSNHTQWWTRRCTPYSTGPLPYPRCPESWAMATVTAQRPNRNSYGPYGSVRSARPPSLALALAARMHSSLQRPTPCDSCFEIQGDAVA